MSGLRPRLFLALLLTSAVTLGIAALALLSPLEHRLRADAESGVFTAIAVARADFAEVEPEPRTGAVSQAQLTVTAGELRRRVGGQITILDGRLNVVYSRPTEDLDVPTFYGQAQRVLRSGRGIHTLTGDVFTAAEPIRIGGLPYVLVFAKRLEHVSSAVKVVRTAFLEAAAAGLTIALLLGIALTTTLLRRLERLREATRELERRGPDAPLPEDPRHDEVGDLTRAFASMQSRLRRQEAARRAFVATASHELRTPLTSLDGMLELLQDDLDAEHLDVEDARGRAARAREQSHRLSQLASDLLDLSRLDAELQLRREPLELGELCRAVAAEFELTAAARAVRVHVTPPPRPCWVAADPGAVARIVRIVLDNALRVAPAGSSVEIEPSVQRGWAHVAVRDDGPGVPESERELIFERFQRGSATGGSSGFGLGLAIGRELAARMGGSLTLHDGPVPDGPGGACFVLALAAVEMQEEEEEEEERSTP
ncbi:MAG TPA: HAMP domain-containing sensor histidine kinase [Solirubrobacteraceae bacterium]